MARRKARAKKKRERERTPAPLSAAGLMTFFEEEVGGIKIRPEIVLLTALGTIIIVLMAHLGIFSI